jgi:hypothetical protein
MTTYTSTANKLASMFTENTGSHMLDSGSAYGRNWERHAGKTVADFMAAKTQGISSDGIVWLDTFHHLNAHLTSAPDLDAMYAAFDALHPNEGYLETVSLWLETLGVDIENTEPYGGVFEYNSANNEYDLLDQTIQAVCFTLGDEAYTALQIHGGCDIRGGYTKPVIFYGSIDDVIFADSTRFYCPSLDHTFSADFQQGIVTDTELGESLPTSDMLVPVSIATELPAGWELQHGCPVCKAQLT